MNGDLINGLFELGGALVTCLSVRALARDREVKGFHPGPTVFFTSWGLWNLWFYPANGLWWSFAGGAALAAVNLVYLSMVAYFVVSEVAGFWLGGWARKRRE